MGEASWEHGVGTNSEEGEAHPDSAGAQEKPIPEGRSLSSCNLPNIWAHLAIPETPPENEHRCSQRVTATMGTPG